MYRSRNLTLPRPVFVLSKEMNREQDLDGHIIKRPFYLADHVISSSP